MKFVKSVFVLVLIFSIALSSIGCTIVRISDSQIISGGKKSDANADPDSVANYYHDNIFDATAFVDGIWDDEVVPYVQENALDFSELIAALSSDFHATGDQFGQSKAKNADSYSFLTKAVGVVLEFNEESRVRFITLDVEPQDGQADLSVYVGPTYKGDSMRNALPFLNFSDFQSQNDWADLTKAINAKVNDTVIAPFDVPALVGKSVEVYGAFTAYEGDEQVSVAPIIMQKLGD